MTQAESTELTRLATVVERLDEKVDGLIVTEARASMERAETTRRLDKLEASVGGLAEQMRAHTAATRRPWSAGELVAAGGFVSTVLGGLASLVYAALGHAPPQQPPPPPPIEAPAPGPDAP